MQIESGHRFLFRLGKENANRVRSPIFLFLPGKENANRVRSQSRTQLHADILSSQHNIQQHHNSKSENDPHGRRISLGLLISLTFRNQLMHSN